jgi:hypothetical protein
MQHELTILEYLRHIDHHSCIIFLNIFAFADEYNMIELRNDVLTVAIELDWAWRMKYNGLLAKTPLISMCKMLPSNAKFYQYVAQSSALHGNFGSDEAEKTCPAEFLV